LIWKPIPVILEPDTSNSLRVLLDLMSIPISP